MQGTNTSQDGASVQEEGTEQLAMGREDGCVQEIFMRMSGGVKNDFPVSSAAFQ